MEAGGVGMRIEGRRSMGVGGWIEDGDGRTTAAVIPRQGTAGIWIGGGNCGGTGVVGDLGPARPHTIWLGVVGGRIGRLEVLEEGIGWGAGAF